MRGLVVGLGSMGKRRVRLMQAFFPTLELCGVDARAERREEAAQQFHIPCYESIGQAIEAGAPALGFVCTSPLSHAGVIQELLERNLHIFTEINLVDDGYETLSALAAQKNLLLFLSSTPLYRKETQYIEETAAQAKRPLVYRYHVGQYLPDWHPWENYKDFFVGDKRTNGCRELFAIELPWLQRAFGHIEHVVPVKRKLTTLQLDYPDMYFVTVLHKSGTVGQIMVDVVSPKAVREFTLIGEHVYLRWNGTPDSLFVYDAKQKQDVAVGTYASVEHDARYAQNIIENAYVDELAAFFDTLRGKQTRRHTFEDDKEILAVIDSIEGAPTA